MNGDYEIPESYHALMSQASSTADEYMRKAKFAIDEQFGKGYAAEHPELVAAFMKTAASDFEHVSALKVFVAMMEQITSALSSIADSLEH